MKKGDRVIITTASGRVLGKGQVEWTDGYVTEVRMADGKLREGVVGKTVRLAEGGQDG